MLGLIIGHLYVFNLTFVILQFHMYRVKYCILLIHELQLIK
jgi:hypothetical protein